MHIYSIYLMPENVWNIAIDTELILNFTFEIMIIVQ